MQKKQFNFTQDYMDSVAHAGVFAIARNAAHISSDDIVYGVYSYLKKTWISNLFWKFIGLKKPEIIENYFQQVYGEPTMTYQWTITLEFQKHLQDDLQQFHDKWLQNFDVLCLLLVALRNSSPSLVTFMQDSGEKLGSIIERIQKLLFEKRLNDMGVMNLLLKLQKTISAMDLSTPDIDLMIDIETIDVDSLPMAASETAKEHVESPKKKKTPKSPYSWPQSDMIDPDTNFESKISSEGKWEEKKLSIEYFGTDLTKEAKGGLLDPVIGREKEINQLIYTLLRKTKNNPLLIWEAWVGKTAIVEWLATKIVNKEVPQKLLNKSIYMLDMWSLLAWTKYRWEFEARLKSILDEAMDPTNNIILFIDELHTIIGAGNSEGSADAANMLKPLLSRWKIQLIWATTYDEYQKHIEKDPALKRRFQEIHVDEPNNESSKLILEWLREKFEDFHGVSISDDAIKFAIEYSTRYILNKHLPDKAIDLIDEAAARKSTLAEKLQNNDEYVEVEHQVKVIQSKIEKAIENQDYFAAAELKEKEEEYKKKMLSLRSQNTLPKHLRPSIAKEDIWLVLSEKLWIPADNITSSEIHKLRTLDAILKWQILGQDEAVDAVVASLRRNRLSVIKRAKPIASFLFLGASWVWKTYVAKLLAKHFFGDDKAMIRVDMSEFTEKYSLSKLIWSAPGYVWYDEGGSLTESVRRKPYSVILFDEIEKASKDVLNILLQVLDEGHLKDSKWRIVDFKNTIIILTSNIWSEEFAKEIPTIWFGTKLVSADAVNENFSVIRQRIEERLKDYLAPELINRFDHVIVFKPLSKEVLGWIFRQRLAEYYAQWAQQEWIILKDFDDKAVEVVINEIYDPAYWARPIERYITNKIEPDIIKQILDKPE